MKIENKALKWWNTLDPIKQRVYEIDIFGEPDIYEYSVLTTNDIIKIYKSHIKI